MEAAAAVAPSGTEAGGADAEAADPIAGMRANPWGTEEGGLAAWEAGGCRAEADGAGAEAGVADQEGTEEGGLAAWEAGGCQSEADGAGAEAGAADQEGMEEGGLAAWAAGGVDAKAAGAGLKAGVEGAGRHGSMGLPLPALRHSTACARASQSAGCGYTSMVQRQYCAGVRICAHARLCRVSARFEGHAVPGDSTAQASESAHMPGFGKPACALQVMQFQET